VTGGTSPDGETISTTDTALPSNEDPVYLTDAAGFHAPVLDERMRYGAMVAANPPAAWAIFRVFRLGQGQRRL
jgi:hypothetical protein